MLIGYPSAAHSAAWRQAFSSTHLPIGAISPLSSARQMNSPGGTTPRWGWSHRSSASTPRRRRVARSMIG